MSGFQPINVTVPAHVAASLRSHLGSSAVSADVHIEEEWRPVVGWETYYEVSSNGRVRSKKEHGTGQALRPSTASTGGYEQVTLSVNGQRKSTKVHILVAAAFIGPRPAGLLIRHLDGNNRNNSARNLAYGTKTENFWDIARHNPDSRLALATCPAGHRITGPNAYRAPKRATGRTCRACRLAAAWASHESARRNRRPSHAERQAKADEKYRELMEAAA